MGDRPRTSQTEAESHYHGHRERLRTRFRDSGETALADYEVLELLLFRLIPRQHAEAWLNALNQARLVISSKYGFNEHDLGDHYRSPIGSRRDLSLFQVNFYGFLQEFILSDMDSG